MSATNGYASPFYYSPSPSSSGSGTPKQVSSKHQKPANVFSNDGSFLERFQRLKQDEEDKKKQEEIFQQKRNFDNRFKTRGKRPAPDSSTQSVTTGSNLPAAKKARSESTSTGNANSKKEDGKGSDRRDSLIRDTNVRKA